MVKAIYAAAVLVFVLVFGLMGVQGYVAYQVVSAVADEDTRESVVREAGDLYKTFSEGTSDN